jgi:SAM-dependent methyltransferase
MDTDDSMNISNVRDYWNERPCNLRHSKLEIGTKEYFDEVEKRKYFVEPHIPGFADFRKWEGKKVLEIGCGLGTDAVNFARSGAEYSAIELSEKSMELAKKRFELFNLKGSFYHGNAEDILSIVPVEKYDLVYSFGVIHHTLNPENVIDSAREYMDSESEFRLMMYAKNSWKNIMIEGGFDQPEAQSGCPVAYTYTHDELYELLGSYDVIDIHQDHIFPFVVEKYVNYEYQLQPWFESMSPDMFDSLCRSLGWHTLIICKLAETR